MRRSLVALAIGLPVLLAMAVLASAEAVLSKSFVLPAVMVILPASGFLAGRWYGRRGNAALARLRDDNAKLKAKIRALSAEINGPEARIAAEQARTAGREARS